MIDMHKKWGNWIKGFGEIKCYNEWEGEELKLDRLSEYWDVCKYAGEHNLPIYIHFSLYDLATEKRFINLLKRFPQTTFVLCHCGMDEKTDNDFCYQRVCKLMKEFGNLWTDVTWKAFDYYSGNPLKLNQLDLSRVILGSDQNKKSKEMGKIIKFNDLSCYINSDRNIKRLFNI
jgi:predicted TIM-barrel fold metal-dependent hydrolase